MDKLKQWVALTVLGVIVIGAAGWFLLLSPKRSEASDIRARAAAQVTSNDALRTQIQMLKQQAKDLPRQQAKLAAVSAKIPDNPALPTLIRALTKAADDSGVELVSLAPSTPQAVANPAAVLTPTAGAKTTGSGTAIKPSAAGAAATAGAAGALQSIALTANVVGGYFQIEQFFDRVENLTRAMKVTGFTLAPGTNPVKPVPAGTTTTANTDPGKVLTAVITSNVYMVSGRAPVSAAVAGK